MRRVRLVVLASLSILAVSPALAQAPQVEKNVSMAMALAIIQGTIEQCTKDGYKASVVIVDKAGNVRPRFAVTAPIPTPWSSAG